MVLTNEQKRGQRIQFFQIAGMGLITLLKKNMAPESILDII